ncbi:uncharacterized protein LOC126595458 [Malus sylvestris]|uniref:uncharacterized protein LOC126595458 n=1 Tax=Malus sylvestris TaxID=3752 RepID=UPI0021AC0DAB|nr:uncharacterized protein LOC126595458 [Malus sylvestris]
MGREVPQQQQVALTVEQLLAVNSYNPDILPDLENYINEFLRKPIVSMPISAFFASISAEEFAERDEHLQCRQKPRSLCTSGCGSTVIQSFGSVQSNTYQTQNGTTIMFRPACTRSVLSRPVPSHSVLSCPVPFRSIMSRLRTKRYLGKNHLQWRSMPKEKEDPLGQTSTHGHRARQLKPANQLEKLGPAVNNLNVSLHKLAVGFKIK